MTSPCKGPQPVCTRTLELCWSLMWYVDQIVQRQYPCRGNLHWSFYIWGYVAYGVLHFECEWLLNLVSSDHESTCRSVAVIDAAGFFSVIAEDTPRTMFHITWTERRSTLRHPGLQRLFIFFVQFVFNLHGQDSQHRKEPACNDILECRCFDVLAIYRLPSTFFSQLISWLWPLVVLSGGTDLRVLMQRVPPGTLKQHVLQELLLNVRIAFHPKCTFDWGPYVCKSSYDLSRKRL